MKAPSRYLFDEVFAHQVERRREPQGVAPADHEAVLERMRVKAHAEGVAEGRRLAERDGDARLTRALDKVVAGITDLQRSADEERLRIEREALNLALTVARKLAPALIARQPTREVEALLRECLGEIRDAPHLVARVAPALVDDMRARLDTLATQTGFTGRIVVLADPEIAVGDGRIDWADGGIVRDTARIENTLDEAIARFLDRQGEAPQTEDATHG